ncbi:hypothetical protein QYM36_013687 [Artemia franciscana]|uniref:Uncharacterized protein n=1 Tax=Artemia franciscana TaxID=6661 RepID=A0AA88HN56_ARTSF|nr:hypothetical protein QYM36_013687 [Artemia franciscana]
MFLLAQKSAFSSLFEIQDWVSSLAYLADIFDKLSDQNLLMQGSWTAQLSLNLKMGPFSKKLEFWLNKVLRNCVSVFPTLDKLVDDSETDNLNTICDFIQEQLTKLRDDLCHISHRLWPNIELKIGFKIHLLEMQPHPHS